MIDCVTRLVAILAGKRLEKCLTFSIEELVVVVSTKVNVLNDVALDLLSMDGLAFSRHLEYRDAGIGAVGTQRGFKGAAL